MLILSQVSHKKNKQEYHKEHSNGSMEHSQSVPHLHIRTDGDTYKGGGSGGGGRGMGMARAGGGGRRGGRGRAGGGTGAGAGLEGEEEFEEADLVPLELKGGEKYRVPLALVHRSVSESKGRYVCLYVNVVTYIFTYLFICVHVYVCTCVRTRQRGFNNIISIPPPLCYTGKALGFLYVKPTEKAGNSPVDAVYPSSSTVHYSSQPISLMQVVLSKDKESVQPTNSTQGHYQSPPYSMGAGAGAGQGQGVGPYKRAISPDG